MWNSLAAKAKAAFGKYDGKLNDTDPAELAGKQGQIDEYVNATKAPQAAPAALPMRFAPPVDRVNPNGQYGQNPGEQRIDVSSFQQPLGSGFAGIGKKK